MPIASQQTSNALSSLFHEAQSAALQTEIARDRARFTDPANAVCLFGAGNTGRELAAMLQKQDITVAAFIDDTPHKQNTLCDGIPILARHLAFEKFGTTALVVVTIYRHGHRYPATKQALEQVGFTHVYSFAHIVRTFPEVAAPYKCFHAPAAYLPFQGTIESIWQSLADDASRMEYERQMRFRLLLDYTAIKPSTDPIYFDPTVLPAAKPEDSIYVDCGAYDGDTMQQFLSWSSGKFKSIVALEPDPANYAKLQALVATQPEAIQKRIRCINAATGAAAGTAAFDASGTLGSSLSDKGALQVKVCALDDVLHDSGSYFIKFDVEGAEPDTLKGLVHTIRDKAPILAISAYHCYDDLWTIPLYLKSIRTDYRLYLRAYGDESMDCVIYALPGNDKQA